MLQRILGNGGSQEERYIDGLNGWFGSVAGIKQATWFIALWTAWNLTAPRSLRFDHWPLQGIVYVITVFSLTSNQFLMNKSIRLERMNESQTSKQDEMLLRIEAQTAKHDEVLGHLALQDAKHEATLRRIEDLLAARKEPDDA